MPPRKRPGLKPKRSLNERKKPGSKTVRTKLDINNPFFGNYKESNKIKNTLRKSHIKSGSRSKRN